MFLEAEQSHEESVLNTGLKEEEGGDRAYPLPSHPPLRLLHLLPHHPDFG